MTNEIFVLNMASKVQTGVENDEIWNISLKLIINLHYGTVHLKLCLQNVIETHFYHTALDSWLLILVKWKDGPEHIGSIPNYQCVQQS